jgi:hypothetical protein
MRTVRLVQLSMIGAMLAAATAGCWHASGRSAGEAESIEQLSIAQVGQIFRVYQKGQRPAPTGLKDLLRLENGYPAAISSIRDKQVLVYWGAGLSDGPDAASTILAYHKDVPEKGGEVLLQDGTARTMTAEEFRAARKPAGASTDYGDLKARKKR